MVENYCWQTHEGQTSMIDLTQPALDLSEFDISGPEGYANNFSPSVLAIYIAQVNYC